MAHKPNIYTIINNCNDCFVKYHSVVFKGLGRNEFIDDRKEFRGSIQDNWKLRMSLWFGN